MCANPPAVQKTRTANQDKSLTRHHAANSLSPNSNCTTNALNADAYIPHHTQRSFAADYQRYAGLKLLPLQPLPGKLTLPSQQAAGAAKSPRCVCAIEMLSANRAPVKSE